MISLNASGLQRQLSDIAVGGCQPKEASAEYESRNRWRIDISRLELNLGQFQVLRVRLTSVSIWRSINQPTETAISKNVILSERCIHRYTQSALVVVYMHFNIEFHLENLLGRVFTSPFDRLLATTIAQNATSEAPPWYLTKPSLIVI